MIKETYNIDDGFRVKVHSDVFIKAFLRSYGDGLTLYPTYRPKHEIRIYTTEGEAPKRMRLYDTLRLEDEEAKRIFADLENKLLELIEQRLSAEDLFLEIEGFKDQLLEGHQESILAEIIRKEFGGK